VPTRRTVRVADLVIREVASIIQKSIKDPRIGIITVTGADVSPDLRLAKVFYTVIGDEEQRKKTSQGLDKARGFIRRELGRVMTTKQTPELRFIYDESLDRGERIEELLERSAAHEPQGDD